MDEIDWSDRLIGIKGTRGVGKSTFLLQYAKEHFGPTDRKCLYVNMNNFYFQSRGIADFAGDFVRHGGRTLLIDQVFKQSDELRIVWSPDNDPGQSLDSGTLQRVEQYTLELDGTVQLDWTADEMERQVEVQYLLDEENEPEEEAEPEAAA
jgi:GTPase SAR1 family protein